PVKKGNPVSMSCFLEESGVFNIFLLDITGKELTEYHYLGNEGNNHISLNFDLSGGVYFVKAIYQGKAKVSPFVVGD
ncbi:MAG: hypothetical protein KDE26_24185, partial [Bacteroidetes bacterium]|nr:hypothetical protein [Bacteroidota bacterium]